MASLLHFLRIRMRFIQIVASTCILFAPSVTGAISTPSWCKSMIEHMADYVAMARASDEFQRAYWRARDSIDGIQSGKYDRSSTINMAALESHDALQLALRKISDPRLVDRALKLVDQVNALRKPSGAMESEDPIDKLDPGIRDIFQTIRNGDSIKGIKQLIELAVSRRPASEQGTHRSYLRSRMFPYETYVTRESGYQFGEEAASHNNSRLQLIENEFGLLAKKLFTRFALEGAVARVRALALQIKIFESSKGSMPSGPMLDQMHSALKSEILEAVKTMLSEGMVGWLPHDSETIVIPPDIALSWSSEPYSQVLNQAAQNLVAPSFLRTHSANAFSWGTKIAYRPGYPVDARALTDSLEGIIYIKEEDLIAGLVENRITDELQHELDHVAISRDPEKMYFESGAMLRGDFDDTRSLTGNSDLRGTIYEKTQSFSEIETWYNDYVRILKRVRDRLSKGDRGHELKDDLQKIRDRLPFARGVMSQTRELAKVAQQYFVDGGDFTTVSSPQKMSVARTSSLDDWRHTNRIVYFHAIVTAKINNLSFAFTIAIPEGQQGFQDLDGSEANLKSVLGRAVESQLTRISTLAAQRSQFIEAVAELTAMNPADDVSSYIGLFRGATDLLEKPTEPHP